MSLATEGGNAIHYPANPDKFEFDHEVADIFENMALRSIPQYREAHVLHAELLVNWFLGKGSRILDVGASRGELFQQLGAAYARTGHLPGDMHWVAIDNSSAMCDALRCAYPDVEVRCQDVLSDAFLQSEETYDVVNCMYIIQFLPPARQYEVLAKLAAMVKPGGVLILGQKDAPRGHLGDMLHDQYIEFRIKNGYSREEILAKTQALKQSMWPMPHHEVKGFLHQHFREVQESTRYTIFSTLLCLK